MGHHKANSKLRLFFYTMALGICSIFVQNGLAQIGRANIGSTHIGLTTFVPATPGISNTPVCFAPGVCSSNPGCPVYIFTGVGDWRIPGNWASSVMPPETLPSCYQIIINSASSEPCVLPNPQTVMRGSSFVVMPGKKLIISGNVFIQ